MKGLRSLHVRLLVGAGMWTAGLLLCAAVVSRARLRAHLEQRYADFLDLQVDEIATSLERDSNGAVVLARPPADRRFSAARSGLYWEVRDGERRLLASPSLGGERLETEGLLSRGRSVTVPARLDIVAAADRHLVDGDEVFLQPAAAAVALVVAGALLALGAVAVHGGLKSFQMLRTRLAAVRGGAVRRLEGEYPSEIQPLVDDLNALIHHNESAIVRASQHSANLAHALKTPLAIIANEASRLSVSGEASGEAIGGQVRLMEDRVGTYLARARAAASGQGLGAHSDVGRALDGVVRVMRRLHVDRPIQIDVQTIPCAFRGEQHDLEEVLGNLLDNACKWTRTRVLVTCTANNGGITFTVDDDGHGLAADRAWQLADGTRNDRLPAGYGLTIVHDLVQTYGGSFQLLASPLGGVRAVVVLPAVTSA